MHAVGKFWGWCLAEKTLFHLAKQIVYRWVEQDVEPALVSARYHFYNNFPPRDYMENSTEGLNHAFLS